ncbi:MAG: DUF115 domain-containing protein [Fretibacterium sp.]|nr:DUF115 domain-containing protein [Fretibacterium sp.]
MSLKALLRDNPKTAPYYHAVRKAVAVPFYRARDAIVIKNKKLIDSVHYIYYTPLFQRSAKILRKYKGKYAGKRCFIIGNGPSLRASDLDKLKDEFTFASNKIHYIYEETAWRPTFYTTQHPEVMKPFISELSALPSELKIIGLDPERYMIPLPNALAIRVLFGFEFSDDITKYVWNGATITHTNLQIAMYFGFSEIILLGVDHHFAKDVVNGVLQINEGVQNYFSPKYDPLGSSIYGSEGITIAYQAAKQYAEQHDIRILNATRGGRLEVFERVDFDDLFRE